MMIYAYYDNGNNVKKIALKDFIRVNGLTPAYVEMPAGETMNTIDPRCYDYDPDNNVIVKNDDKVLECKVVDEAKSMDSLQTKLDGYLKTIHNEISKKYGYDSIVSVRSWTSFPNPYQRDCAEISKWAGSTYSALEVLLLKY